MVGVIPVTTMTPLLIIVKLTKLTVTGDPGPLGSEN